jgi:hypothetical protein
METSKTLPNAQRASVLAEYRNRGRSNGNLWLVYSVKTDRDWILPSDRHLLLWLAYLESNPAVRTFSFTDQDRRKNRPASGAGQSDAVATFRDGSVEHHTIAGPAHNLSKGPDHNFPDYQQVMGSALSRVVTDDDLRCRAVEAMRWLKVVSFAAPLRGQELTAATVAVVAALRSFGSGRVCDVVHRLADFDRPTVLGIIARTAIHGDISLHLNIHGFTLLSQWKWREEKCAGLER